MSIAYYGFAFFVFVLACLFLGVYRFMFNIARERKLDEKESKLLSLYQIIEEAMEEFRDYVDTARTELGEKADALQAASQALGARQNDDAKPDETPTPESKKPANKRRRPETPTPAVDITLPEEPHPKISRKDQILTLRKNGLTPHQIAQELGITRSEAELVLEIAGK